MAPILPRKSDFPATLAVDIVAPPPSHAATNVLILLHGLGDTQLPFTSFARAMSLPDTCALAIRAPAPLPFDLGGFHWGDDILLDQAASGAGDGAAASMDAGFARAGKLIAHEVVRGVLREKCGYAARDVVLFGLGQGGMLALAVAAQLGAGASASEKEEELGGVVSIGAGLPAETARIVELGKGKRRTPVLVCKARDGSAVTDEDEDALRSVFEFVQISEWAQRGDGMPRNRDEMLPVMQFFARRLRSVRGVPAGSVEISP